jgi:hypothetical protein
MLGVEPGPGGAKTQLDLGGPVETTSVIISYYRGSGTTGVLGEQRFQKRTIRKATFQCFPTFHVKLNHSAEEGTLSRYARAAWVTSRT